MRMLRPRRFLIALTGALLLCGISLWAVDGPLTNALNLRVRTDDNGYLIAAGGAYSGTDGPLTNFGNLRLRTDGNGYLIVTLAAASSITVNGIAVTSTDGLLLQNTTAATVGVPVQYSPRLRLCGTGWKTDATTASQIDCDLLELRPVSAAGATTSSFAIARSINGGAYADILTLSSAGLLQLAAGITSGGNVTLPVTSSYGWTGRTLITSSADALITVTNNAASSGFGLQAATADTMIVANQAQNAYGIVDALTYKASTIPITSGSTHLSAGSGMAVANVGANSCGTSAASIAGNNNANVTTVGATAGTQCRVAFTFAATTEWVCAANDDTTTVAVRTTPVDTTHTDLIGTFTAGDKISAICFPR